MTIKADLLVMRAYLEKGWAQGSYAQDKSGNPVRANDPDAARWCILGASQIAKVAKVTIEFLNRVIETPVVFNDDPLRTQADVLAKMDELIEMAPS